MVKKMHEMDDTELNSQKKPVINEENLDRWTMRLPVHSRIDIPEDHVVIDSSSAKWLAAHLNLEEDHVSGMRIGVTSYPYKNRMASVTLEVLARDSIMDYPHVTLHPVLVKHMGSDAVVLHHDIYKMSGPDEWI